MTRHRLLALLLAAGWTAAGLIATSPAQADARVRVGPNVPATPEDLVDRTANNSPLLVADPTESRFVVLANRQDGPDFNCALQVSGDSGHGWVSANPVPALPAGADKCYAPEVAFDRRGRLYYLFVGLAGAGNSPMGVFLTTSTDRANTFAPPVQVLGPERYQVRMAIDPSMGDRGRIHLVWLQASSTPPLGGLGPPPNPIMAAYSDDGGRRFSTPVIVSDPERQRVVAPALAVGPRHSVHILYYDLRDDSRDYNGLEGPTFDGRWSLVAATSADGGARFGHGVPVDDDLVPPERVMLVYTMPPPAVAADAHGRVFAAWYDARNGDWDVFVRRSLDGGRTWAAPVRLNDDPLHDGAHQYLPRLAVSPDGRVDAVFYDRRGNKENRGNDVFYATSDNHGATFGPNVKITTSDSDSKIGPRYDVPSAAGLNEFGSRIALMSERSHALAAWTDTRNTGHAFPAQDVFAASLSVGDAGGSPWWIPWIGIGAVLFVVVGAVVLWRLYKGTGAAAATVALMASACSGASGAALPPAPPTVHVAMREYAFDYKPPTRGRVVLQVINRGTEAHRLSVVPLPEDLPPIDVQLHGAERRALSTLAAVPDTPPGGVGAVALDLAPGRYAFICFIESGGQSHALRGMASEFRVQ